MPISVRAHRRAGSSHPRCETSRAFSALSTLQVSCAGSLCPEPHRSDLPRTEWKPERAIRIDGPIRPDPTQEVDIPSRPDRPSGDRRHGRTRGPGDEPELQLIAPSAEGREDDPMAVDVQPGAVES